MHILNQQTEVNGKKLLCAVIPGECVMMNTSIIKSITVDGDFNVNADDDPIKQESASEEADGEFTQLSFPQSANLSSSQRAAVDIERLPSKSTVFTHNKPVKKKSDSNLFESSWAIFTHNMTYSHIVKKYFVDTSTTANNLILPTDNDTTVINYINNGDDDAQMNHDDDDDDDEPLSKSFVKLHPNSSLSSLVPKYSFETKKQQNQLARNREKIKTLQQEFRRLKQRNIELKNIIKSI